MLGDLLRETFPGFEQEALKFLKDLRSEKKNNKEWFDKNREKYETYIKEPMRHLTDTLAERLFRIDPDIVVNYKSIFRINRDIRFSKVKTPYKTYSSAAFAFYRVKTSEIPQFYFHFGSDEFLFAAGQYSTDPVYLKKIRKYILRNFNEYSEITGEKKFRKRYGEVKGESLKQLPAEYRSYPEALSNPKLAEALKMKQYYVFETHKPDVVLNEGITDLIADNIVCSHRFTKFLTEAIRN